MMLDMSKVGRLYCEVINKSELVPIFWEHTSSQNTASRWFNRTSNVAGYHVGKDGTLEIANPKQHDNGHWACRLPNKMLVNNQGAFVTITVVGKLVKECSQS